MANKKIIKTFPNGSKIIKQGESSEDMYIIESGIVEISLELKNGTIIPITRLGVGEFFGEMSFYNEGTRSATVTAVSDLKVQVIKKNDVYYALENAPMWFQEMFKKMIERIKYSNLAMINQAETQNELFKSERLQAAMEVAGAAAHEINQPLTILTSVCELLKKEATNKKIEHYSEKIIEATERIAKIVSQMQVIQKYVTKPYVGNINILDLDKSSENSE